jgi:hypothetical protein
LGASSRQKGKPKVSLDELNQLAGEAQAEGIQPQDERPYWQMGLDALNSLGNVGRNVIAKAVGVDTSELRRGTFGLPIVDTSDILKTVGWKEPISRAIVGFVGDVLTDPLTYVAGGAIGAGGKGVKSLAKAGARGIEEGIAKGSLTAAGDVGKVLLDTPRGKWAERLVNLTSQIKAAPRDVSKATRGFGKVAELATKEATELPAGFKPLLRGNAPRIAQELAKPAEERLVTLRKLGAPEMGGRALETVAQRLGRLYMDRMAQIGQETEEVLKRVRPQGSVGEGADAGRRLIQRYVPRGIPIVHVPTTNVALRIPTRMSRNMERLAAGETIPVAGKAMVEGVAPALEKAKIVTPARTPAEAQTLARGAVTHLQELREQVAKAPATMTAVSPALKQRTAAEARMYADRIVNAPFVHAGQAGKLYVPPPGRQGKLIYDKLISDPVARAAFAKAKGWAALEPDDIAKPLMGQAAKQFAKEAARHQQAIGEFKALPVPLQELAGFHAAEHPSKSLRNVLQSVQSLAQKETAFGTLADKEGARVLATADQILPGAAQELANRGHARTFASAVLSDVAKVPPIVAQQAEQKSVRKMLKRLGIITKGIKEGQIEPPALQAIKQGFTTAGMKAPGSLTRQGLLVETAKRLKAIGGPRLQEEAIAGRPIEPFIAGQGGLISAIEAAKRVPVKQIAALTPPGPIEATAIGALKGLKKLIGVGTPSALGLKKIVLERASRQSIQEGIAEQTARGGLIEQIAAETKRPVPMIKKLLVANIERSLIRETPPEDISRRVLAWIDRNPAIGQNPKFLKASEDITKELVQRRNQGVETGLLKQYMAGGYFPRLLTAKAEKVIKDREARGLIAPKSGPVDTSALKGTTASAMPRSTIQIDYEHTLPNGKVQTGRFMVATPEQEAQLQRLLEEARLGKATVKELPISTLEANRRARMGEYDMLLGKENRQNLFVDDPAMAVAFDYARFDRAMGARNYYKFIAETYGHWIDDAAQMPEGFSVPQSHHWQSIWQDLPGYETRTPMGLITPRKPMIAVPTEVADHLETISRIYDSPEEIKNVFALNRAMLLLWKTQTLLFRLSVGAFFGVQAIGNALQLVAMGARPQHLPFLLDAWRVARGVPTAFDLALPSGAKMSGEEFAHFARKYQIISGAMAGGREFGMGHGIGEAGRYEAAKFGARGAEPQMDIASRLAYQFFESPVGRKTFGAAFEFNRRHIDDTSKVYGYMIRLLEGEDPETAARTVKRYLYDFEMQSTEFERRYIEPFIPFARWQKNNTYFQLAELIRQPRYAALLPKFQQATTVEDPMDPRLIPDWIREGLGIQITGDKKGGIAVVAGNILPQQDLRVLYQPATYGVSTLSPLFRVPMEVVKGESLFTGRKLQRTPDEPLAVAVAREELAMPREVSRLLQMRRELEASPGFGVARILGGGRVQQLNAERAKMAIDIDTSKEAAEIRSAIGRPGMSPEHKRNLVTMYFAVLRKRQQLGLYVQKPLVPSLKRMYP